MSPLARPQHRWILALLAAAWLNAPPTQAAQALMTWADLTRTPAPKATRRIAYGPATNQVIDLWLPEGPGPFPVVLMLHGGCWRASIANLGIMNYIAGDLRRRGVAVWNIEYRGVDQPGGGYPGTFQDVAAAADALRQAAPDLHLELDHVVAVGHSAGGHLALWLAARRRLPASSPLHADDPLPIAAVVSLGGLADLAAVRELKDDAGCGAAVVDAMSGRAAGRSGDVYADTSPAALLPLGVPQLLVQGDLDPVSPPYVGWEYRAKARKRGERVRVIVIPATGHAELIAPRSAAWVLEALAIQAYARGAGPGPVKP